MLNVKQFAALDQHVLLTQFYIYLPSHVIGTVWLNDVYIGCPRILSELVVVSKSMPIENITKCARSYSLYSISFLKNLTLFPVVEHTLHPIDYIMNKLPRSEFGLSLCKWKPTWPNLLHVLRKIDWLSHPDEQFDEDELNPEEALNQSSSQHSRTSENT